MSKQTIDFGARIELKKQILLVDLIDNHKYSLKQLKELYDKTDKNNPNKEELKSLISFFKRIGFFGEDEQIGSAEDYENVILKELAIWVEKERM